ncbi:radical SAM protein [Candidatus Falkowbacteria bacterium CG_4_8_14_3_um_filter_36_11]|nr:MAG: radical SAM protein [Candidatus Falkowbacteria bacterium CG_4_8_14_3_um_filter_36_11]
MKIQKIQCKNILTKSKLPASDYCINPYIGCTHKCFYCYARFMKRFTNHKEKWGEFVDVKINAAEILNKQLCRKHKRGVILLGSVTDAYQPLERKYGITRAILKILLRYDFPISILTKSNLVTRDIDLLKQFTECEVGLTITTLNKKAAQNFEPGASTPEQRIKTMEILHAAGIKTYAFIGPILPEFTNLNSIFHALQGKADLVMAETLNIKCGNWQDIQEILKKEYPSRLQLFKLGLRKSANEEVEAELMRLSNKFNLPIKGFYQH